jgi:hypothetical protein
MTRQRFGTTAEKLYNCNLISQLQKNVQLLFHFTTAKFYVRIIETMHNCYFLLQLRKNCTTVKQKHNSKKDVTTAKQIYCNNAEALTGYSRWEIITLLLFSLAFSLKCNKCAQISHSCTRVCIGLSRVGLVWSGASVVRTKQSGALLKCTLGCALLAHFASEVRSSQAKCTLKIGVRRPSAHLKAPQTDFATCALPKCASRAQNPTFAPYLHTSFSALESYSSFLWCFYR